MSGQDTQAYHWQYTELDDRNFQIRGRTLFYVVVLFSIIIIVTLLILYARWVCRFSNSLSPFPQPYPSPAPNAPPPRSSRGLDPAAISGLPVVILRSRSSKTAEEMECSICLGAIEEGEKVKVLPPCRHCYHCECVDRWLAAQSICPLCRANLRLGSALPPQEEVVVVTQ